jgi:hypothetical protein
LRHSQYYSIGILALSPFLAASAGPSIRGGILHPARLNRMRLDETDQMFERTGSTKSDFNAPAHDGVRLKGWKVRPPTSDDNWVLLYHGVSDNGTGDLGHAERIYKAAVGPKELWVVRGAGHAAALGQAPAE